MLATSSDLEPFPPLRERLGGRWLISRVGFVVASVGLLVSVFVREPEATASAGGALRWLVACAVASVASGLFLLVLDHSHPYRGRRTHPVGLAAVAFVTVVGMVLVALALQSSALALGLEPAQSLGVRIVGLLVVGGWFALAIVIGLDRIDRSLRNQHRLIERQVANEFATIQQALLVDDIRKEILDEIDSELDGARRQIRRRLDALSQTTDLAALAEVSSELRDLADAPVRTLGLRLHQAAHAARPRVRWWTLLGDVIRQEPFHPGILVFIDVVGGFEALVATFGLRSAVPMMAASVATVLVLTVGANRLMRRWPDRHLLVFVTTVVLIQLSVVPMVAWRESLVPGSAPLRWVVLQVTGSVVVIVVTAVVGSYWRVRDSQQADIARELSSERAAALARGRVLADLTREASVVLHGSVQTRLVACAMRSERAIAAGDLDEIEAALVEAARAVDGFVLAPAAGTTLALEIGRKVELWGELCDVRVRVDPLLAQASSSLAVTVGRVVEEALSNAIRHGDATVVDIALGCDGADVSVVVDDNGTGLPADVRFGMGAAYVAQASAGHWRLVRRAHGTRLIATISAG